MSGYKLSTIISQNSTPKDNTQTGPEERAQLVKGLLKSRAGFNLQNSQCGGFRFNLDTREAEIAGCLGSLASQTNLINEFQANER